MAKDSDDDNKTNSSDPSTSMPKLDERKLQEFLRNFKDIGKDADLSLSEKELDNIIKAANEKFSSGNMSHPVDSDEDDIKEVFDRDLNDFSRVLKQEMTSSKFYEPKYFKGYWNDFDGMKKEVSEDIQRFEDLGNMYDFNLKLLGCTTLLAGFYQAFSLRKPKFLLYALPLSCGLYVDSGLIRSISTVGLWIYTRKQFRKNMNPPIRPWKKYFSLGLSIFSTTLVLGNALRYLPDP